MAPLEVPPADRALLVASLTPPERARADRYRFPADARRFSVARGWLRLVLGAELGIPAPDVTFADTPGKPRLAPAGGPCFNLSHAGELAVIAVSAGAVGVDVEPEASAPAALEAAAIACTPAEAAALDRLPAEDRPLWALRLWTAKEAYLKATGEGLSAAPDQVEIAAPWTVRALCPAPGYVGAVAAEGEDWEVVLRSAHLVSDRR